jgi:hypothetical protein
MYCSNDFNGILITKNYPEHRGIRITGILITERPLRF